MSAQVDQNKQQFEFKAEMKQLLKLIINSLYTNPEVFLRELVSNSSDALNKVRLKKLTEQNIINKDDELKIKIDVDKDKQTFSIEDNGIGMTEDDLVNRLGTVASSGTAEFLSEYQKSGKKLDAEMIGRFGVGFYATFMVTDEIIVETRHADQGSKAYRWISSGEDSFEIEEIEREDKGTKISFKLKDEFKEFAEEYKIKSTLQKYSNFVEFPIYLGKEKVNTVTALWHKKKEEIKNDELNEFYKFISNDYQDPLGHIHLDMEGTVNFKALLFIPQTAPPQLFRENIESTVHLYSSKVFIQDDAKGLLPDYLKFVKGVVDTEDLPLNVSREVTQNSPLMAKIKNILTKKVLSLLEDWAENDKDKYKNFFMEFGPLFKTGVNSDFTNKDRIVELLRFESSDTKEEELTSFNGYVYRMQADQKEIYYATGNTKDQILKNPNLEYFRKNDIEVLYLTDPVDIFTIPYLQEYDGKNLVSVEKADIDLDKDSTDKSESDSEAVKSIVKQFKDTLGDKVEDVRESKRLVDSPVTLVVGQQGQDPQMEKMMKMIDKNYQSSKKILELNPNHPIIRNLSKLNIANPGDPMLKNTIQQLYEGAMLKDGDLQSPADFVDRMHEFIEKATNK